MSKRLFVGTPWRQAVWQSLALVGLALMLSFAVNGLRSDGLPWIQPVGQWVGETGLEISLDEAQILYLTDQAVFLDARSPEAYRSGHIDKALNLPWVHFSERASEVLDGLPKETPIVTYCDEGCRFSEELAAALTAQGYAQVRALMNGWSAWLESGFPVATGP
ncbi:rhodanese-like domain-containing protein [Desulfosoma caldarium]|uniref:Rhodanese-related sulfurtransferase n=1 Tax=Desulfosoma caldarium TaxID=610254 RepID=A0A3N1UMD0_9BACT|nr:rhodanese-like domain-containing protein [Desulfosoma caldarium]ROQ92355.1 rhodanese-related sulfurtransferase [Desulfosoma caldarium]